MEKDIRLIRESRVYGFAFDERATHALDSRQSLYYIKVPLTIRSFGWFLRTIIDTNIINVGVSSRKKIEHKRKPTE